MRAVVAMSFGAAVALGWAALGWAQAGIFADGVELGHPCRWSQQVPAADCTGAEVTVLLPGGVELTLVRIPAGTFQMGSPDGERSRDGDEDLHQVTLTQDYYISRDEITQAQWEAVTGAPMPPDCGAPAVGPTFPVYCVSWNDIVGQGGFLEALNTHLGTTAYRLPTEAEFERAMRAGTQSRFTYGDVLECGDDCEACDLHEVFMWWCGNWASTPQPVGAKLANGFGLTDMHGNLWEWVQDWYAFSLGTSPETDPTGPATGDARVERGGSWNSPAWNNRSAARDGFTPDTRLDFLGFRVVSSPATVPGPS